MLLQHDCAVIRSTLATFHSVLQLPDAHEAYNRVIYTLATVAVACTDANADELSSFLQLDADGMLATRSEVLRKSKSICDAIVHDFSLRVSFFLVLFGEKTR